MGNFPITWASEYSHWKLHYGDMNSFFQTRVYLLTMRYCFLRIVLIPGTNHRMSLMPKIQ